MNDVTTSKDSRLGRLVFTGPAAILMVVEGVAKWTCVPIIATEPR